MCLLAARQFKEAQNQAKEVLTLAPNDVDAHVLLANAYAALQDVRESLREMQTAIQLAPDQPKTYLNMALLQLSAKDAAEAERNFLKALSLDAKSVPAQARARQFLRPAETLDRSGTAFPLKPFSWNRRIRPLTRPGQRS